MHEFNCLVLYCMLPNVSYCVVMCCIVIGSPSTHVHDDDNDAAAEPIGSACSRPPDSAACHGTSWIGPTVGRFSHGLRHWPFPTGTSRRASVRRALAAQTAQFIARRAQRIAAMPAPAQQDAATAQRNTARNIASIFEGEEHATASGTTTAGEEHAKATCPSTAAKSGLRGG